MRALLEDLALFHDDDLVAVHHGGKSVGDDDRGAACEEIFKCFLDQGFAWCIERAGGFVENHQRWVHAQGTGDGQSLALTLAELVATFANHGFIAFFKLHREVVDQRGLGRRFNFFLSGFRAAVANIFGDCAAKNDRLLRNDPNPATDTGG